MANNVFEKQQNILYNSVPEQRLTQPNQLTIKSWNDIINILKTQANINTDYLQKLHNWFIGHYDDTKDFNENIINIPVDEIVFGDYSPSFAEYVLNEIKYIIETPLVINNKVNVETIASGTLVNPVQGEATVQGTGRRNNPLEFNLKIPRGFDGYGIHFFNIDEYGNLILYRERQEQFGDNYEIDETTGELVISFEVE